MTPEPLSVLQMDFKHEEQDPDEGCQQVLFNSEERGHFKLFSLFTNSLASYCGCKNSQFQLLRMKSFITITLEYRVQKN
mgnify:CR=1 FL=1